MAQVLADNDSMTPLKLSWLALAVAAGTAQAAVWIDLSGTWRMDNRKDVRFPIGDRPPSGTREYTRTVELPPEARGVPLALTVGEIGEWYEIRVDGVIVGSSGSPEPKLAMLPRPRTFDLPPMNRESITIAIRASRFDGRTTKAWWAIDEGPWLLTSPEAAPRTAGEFAIAKRKLMRFHDLAQRLILAALGLAGLLVYLRDRRRSDLLWLAAILCATALTRLFTYLVVNPDSTPFAHANRMIFWREWVMLLLIAQLAHVTVGVPRVLLWPLRLFAGIAAFASIPVWNLLLLGARILLIGGIAYGYLHQRPKRLVLSMVLVATVYTQNAANSIGLLGLPPFEEATIQGYRFHPFVMVVTVLSGLIWWRLIAGSINPAAPNHSSAVDGSGIAEVPPPGTPR